MMKTCLVAGLAVLWTAGTVAVAARQNPYPPAKPQPMAPAGSLQRGAQLVLLGGCEPIRNAVGRATPPARTAK